MYLCSCTNSLTLCITVDFQLKSNLSLFTKLVSIKNHVFVKLQHDEILSTWSNHTFITKQTFSTFPGIYWQAICIIRVSDRRDIRGKLFYL